MWLDMGTSAEALIVLGFGMERPDLIAMPVALSDTSCASVKRLWFLHKSEESDNITWNIAEKFVMWTLMPIEPNSSNITRMSDQVIQ